MLAAEVDAFLDRHPGLLDRLASAPRVNPTQPRPAPLADLDAVIEDPPATAAMPAAETRPWLSRKGRRVDFAARDAANRQLGRLGERFVVDLERHRLTAAGRDDLARLVVWAAQDIGDGLGLDVLSFDEADDSERVVEVKTTGLGKHFPFYVTGVEVRCSEDVPERYHLFRVFDFGRQPRLYILHGSLRDRCTLEPVVFRVTV